MKKVFKYGSVFLGAAAIITGVSSCEKEKKTIEEEEPIIKCCTIKYDTGDSEKICEDDEDFKELDITWNEFSSYAEDLEGSYGIEDVECD